MDPSGLPVDQMAVATTVTYLLEIVKLARKPPPWAVPALAVALCTLLLVGLHGLSDPIQQLIAGVQSGGFASGLHEIRKRTAGDGA